MKSDLSSPEVKLEGVNITAFVGSAGTGKSQRAQIVAINLGIDYIIDDGLVIHRGQIVSGKSAKAEKNQIRAIRRALFQFEDHRRAVRSYLDKVRPCSVMIIATSDEMISHIVENLGLPVPEKTIRIEEVASSEEILNAQKERNLKGQHVIPVSHVQVRRNFAGKLVGRLRVLWSDRGGHEGEKTIVRPPFNFYGDLHIAPTAVEQIGRFVALRSRGIAKVLGFEVRPSEEGIAISISVRAVIGERNLSETGAMLRERVFKAVSYFTGLDVRRIDVHVQEVEKP
ncbi:MAG: hypothetical protein ACP5CD_00355 [Thermovirgaceae bacterium]